MQPSPWRHCLIPAKSRATMNGFICDLDGVVHRGAEPLPGAAGFVKRLQRSGRPYLFLTNSPEQTAAELSRSLKQFHVDVPAEKIYTALEATVHFIGEQKRRPRVFVIGSPSLKR